MNSKIDLSWEYNGWRKASSTPLTITQKAWNQTLITKINQCSAQIYKQSHLGSANIIECHKWFEPLFNDLHYYNLDEKVLGGKYRVIFKEEVSDIIKIYNHKTPLLIKRIIINGYPNPRLLSNFHDGHEACYNTPSKFNKLLLLKK